MHLLSAIVLLFIPAALAAAEATPGVIRTTAQFPPEGAAWSGTAAHVFLGGQAMLFCGTHGTLSGNTDPPEASGSSVDVEYTAVFNGELSLTPPLVPQTRVMTLREPIRMAERITNTGQRGNVTTYTTELTAVEFDVSAFSGNIRIRESRSRASAGRMTISRQGRGSFAIQGSYRVWLEISTDGGRTWELASDAVTMRLIQEPESGSVTPVRRRILRQN